MKLFKWRSRDPKAPSTENSISFRLGNSWTQVALPVVMPSPAAESIEVINLNDATDWFVDAVMEVGRLSRLPPDWDSYGSPSITKRATTAAIRVLTAIGRTNLPIPDVAAVSGGGLGFEWAVGPRALELEVLPDGSIAYLRDYEDDRMSEGRIAPNRLDHIKEQVNWLIQHPA